MRGEILRTVEIFRCKVVDVSPNEMTIEATGDQNKLDAIISLLQRFGIKELARTGAVAMLQAAERLEQVAQAVSTASTQLSAQIEQSDKGAVHSAQLLTEAATAMLFSIPLLWPLTYGRLGRLGRRDVALLLLSGLFLAGDVALWNTSFSYTTVANANLLTNLTPFTVIPVSYFIFRERLPRLFIPGAAVTLAGVVLLLGGKASPSAGNYWGDMLALAAAFFYAGFLLIAYRLRDTIESSVIMR